MVSNQNPPNILLLTVFFLITNNHIFASKIAEGQLSMRVFLALLNDKIRIKEAIAQKTIELRNLKRNGNLFLISAKSINATLNQGS